MWRNQVEKKSASRTFALGELLCPFFSPLYDRSEWLMQIDDEGKLGWRSRYVFHIFWFPNFTVSSFLDGAKSKNDLFLVVLASMDATLHLKWNQGCSSCGTATRSSLPSVSEHWIWWLVQKQAELTNTRTKLV
jgi:hypothetical protein